MKRSTYCLTYDCPCAGGHLPPCTSVSVPTPKPGKAPKPYERLFDLISGFLVYAIATLAAACLILAVANA